MEGNFATVLLFILLYAFQSVNGTPSLDSDKFHMFEPGRRVVNNETGMRIFCHKAQPKYLIHVWKTLIMKLDTDVDTYDLYDGKNAIEVLEKHEDNLRSWSFNFFGTKKSKEIKISPFEDTCIGIYIYNYNQHQYTMTMTQLRIDFWKVMMLVMGIALFWYAQKLSHNVIFYYICGITLGVSTSIIILIYFVSKLLPRGKTMYLLAATGWTMSFYIAQALWENAQLIAMQYRELVLWYIIITSLISFIVCYRFGPVTNERTKKIIQWFLQVFSLLMIFYSSSFREASVGFCVLLILIYNFPVIVVHKGKILWKTMFPKRRRLLTEDEYRKEGVRETNKALKELREYCSSPECNQWRTVLRIKDPIRFAKFVEGNAHLRVDEVLQHDAETSRLLQESTYTDDEGYSLTDSD